MWKKPAGNFVGCAVRVERAVVGDHVDAQAGDLAVLGADLGLHDVVAGEARSTSGSRERSSIHLTGTPATIEPAIAHT